MTTHARWFCADFGGSSDPEPRCFAIREWDTGILIAYTPNWSETDADHATLIAQAPNLLAELEKATDGLRITHDTWASDGLNPSRGICGECGESWAGDETAHGADCSALDIQRRIANATAAIAAAKGE